MKTINLKEMYSDYYIREWKKQGLILITQRPPTTTETLLEQFFSSYKPPTTRNRKKAIYREIKKRENKRLDWREFLPEQYKWKKEMRRMGYKINWNVFPKRMAMILFILFISTMILSDLQYTLYHL